MSKIFASSIFFISLAASAQGMHGYQSSNCRALSTVTGMTAGVVDAAIPSLQDCKLRQARAALALAARSQVTGRYSRRSLIKDRGIVEFINPRTSLLHRCEYTIEQDQAYSDLLFKLVTDEIPTQRRDEVYSAVTDEMFYLVQFECFGS